MPSPPGAASRRGRPRRRRRVFAVLGGALLLAVVFAVIAWLALDDPLGRVAGAEYEAVAVERQPEPSRGPEDLQLELFSDEGFSVLRPEGWAGERRERDDREDGYDVVFEDPHEAHGFRLTYIRADAAAEPPDAAGVLESVEQDRAEELDDYEQLRLEEAEPHALPGAPQAALAESTYTVGELDRLVGGWDHGERFRVQYLISDGSRLHSLLLVGPEPEREAHAPLIEEIFASFEIDT